MNRYCLNLLINNYLQTADLIILYSHILCNNSYLYVLLMSIFTLLYTVKNTIKCLHRYKKTLAVKCLKCHPSGDKPS